MFKLDVFELDIKTPLMIKANDKDTRVTSNEVKLGHVCICKILFKSNTKDQKKIQKRSSGVFNVNFE